MNTDIIKSDCTEKWLKFLSIFSFCMLGIVLIDTFTSGVLYDRMFVATLCDYPKDLSVENCILFREIITYWFLFSPPLFFGCFFMVLNHANSSSKTSSNNTLKQGVNDA